jgi:hypothetical protein
MKNPGDMRRRTRTGKIPPAERPRIHSRYLGGDSLANIARDYGCTVRLIEGLLKETAERRAAVGAEARVAHYGGPFAGYGIDKVLRRRVTDTMVTFLFSFDHVLKANTKESMQDFQNATENLLRAAARVRLALELAARKCRH